MSTEAERNTKTVEVWTEEPDCRVRVAPWGGGAILTIVTPWLQNDVVVSVADWRWKRIVAATTTPVDLPLPPAKDALAVMNENDRLRRVIASAISLLDKAMGDTDPQDEDNPLLLACQMLSQEIIVDAR
jgi:hypothetical protein